MAKRRRKSTTPPLSLTVGLGTVGIIIVILGYILGVEVLVEEDGVSVVMPVTEEESQPVPVVSDGDYYSLYFTDPVIPDDGGRTGGIDRFVVEAINGAQSTLDIAAFEFNLQTVADALLDAHARGVRVRMVDDSEHTEDSEQMEQLRTAGIPVVDDDRSALMHNKFIVIDSIEVWAGSMNFTENGVYRNNNNLIHITSAELAANYTVEFEEMFLDGSFGPTSPSNTPSDRLNINGVSVENYFSPEDDVLDHIRAQVARADTSIHFMSFSFTLDDLGDVMLDRAANGVEVVGIFEVRGANTQFSECPRMLSQGLDVRLDGNPGTFHHKVIIIDGEVLITGSFNFSNNAIQSNDENLLIIHDSTLAALYEAEFAARLAEAQLPVGGECLTS